MPHSSSQLDSDAILKNAVSNYSLLLPYFAPYIAYVGMASLFSGLSTELSYSLIIIAVATILIWSRRRYVPLTGPSSTLMSVVWGLLCGLLGTALWLFMLSPFGGIDSGGWSKSAFYLRLIASAILVPIFEELLMRGYIFRLAYQWDRQRKKNKKKALDRVLHDQCINNFEPGAWSTAAILVSTAVFTLGHQIQEWPAAFLYGMLMVFLLIKRQDLISCIVAHGTTNFALALYVYLS